MHNANCLCHAALMLLLSAAFSAFAPYAFAEQNDASTQAATSNSTSVEQNADASSPPPASIPVNEPTKDPVEHREPAEPNPTRLDDVVVTAAKRKESIQRVAASVWAVTGDSLEKIGATKFTDFANYLPGLSYSSNGAGNNVLVVRGVTTGSQTSGTVGLVVDEVPIGSATNFAGGAFALDFVPYDLSRVELLSGPQGTLYGADSLGGLLKYVTSGPDLFAWQAQINPGASLTHHGAVNEALRSFVNVPLIEDRLAVRLDGFLIKDAGFIDDPGRSLRRVDAGQTSGGRASLLWQLTKDSTFQVSYMRQRITRGSPVVADRDPHTHAPVQGPYDQSFFLDQPFASPMTLYSGVLNLDFGWASLLSASGWQGLSTTQSLDETKTVYGLFEFSAGLGSIGRPPQGHNFAADFATATRKFTQEIRLTSPTLEYADWQLGVFAANELSNDALRTRDAQTADGSLLGTEIYNSSLHSHYRELAGFVDVTAHFTDRIDTIFGFRQSKERLSYVEAGKGLLVSATMPNTEMVTDADHDGKVRNYLVNPRFQINPDLQVFGRVASGYRPGGPNFVASGLTGTPNGPPSFGPDSDWSYELGTKGRYFERAIALNLSIYHIDWKNIQVLVVTANGASIQNAGNAKVNGAELSISGRIGSGLAPGLSVSLSDARLVQGDAGLGASAHAPLPLSSRFAATAFCDYTAPFLGNWLSVSGFTYRFVGKRPAGFDGSSSIPQYWMARYGVLDLRSGVKLGWMNVDLYLRNVFNGNGELSADASSTAVDPNNPVHVTPTEPRTVGVELRMDFGR